MNLDKVETESITKVARTDKDVDNTSYELKQLCTFTDDYGTERTFYRKVVVLATQYEAELLAEKAKLSKALTDITAVEDKLKELPKIK